MSTLEELEELLAKTQALIDLYTTFPEDTFNLGTVALFTAHSNTVKWYYEKVAEESWRRLSPGGDEEYKSLADWLFLNKTTYPDYFEVYTMAPSAAPIYTSS